MGGGSVGISPFSQEFEQRCRNLNSFTECLKVVALMISELKLLALRQGLGSSWENIVGPWLTQHPQMDKVPDPSSHLASSACTSSPSACTSSPSACTSSTSVSYDQQPARSVVERPRATIAVRAAPGLADGQAAVAEPVAAEAPDAAVAEPVAAESEPPERVEDLLRGDIADDPWQYKPYKAGNASWMAAAQRKHSHRRRTNQLLGVASVDLSGPHEPTPRVGAKVGERPGQYFCVLTIRPHNSASTTTRGTQCNLDAGEIQDEPSEQEEARGGIQKNPSEPKDAKG